MPLTVVWAGTSALSLLNNIRTRQVGPVGAVQRVGFVLFTGLGQIVSAFSRMGAASMTYLPPNRSGHLTDRSLLTRAVQRPANAPDAFRSAFEEFCTGVLAGAAGTLLDPVQARQSDSPCACLRPMNALMSPSYQMLSAYSPAKRSQP